MVGVVLDDTDRALIAQRTEGKHHAGGWEFPGGKLEPGEARVSGLARELREELGISIQLPRPLIRVAHDYPYGQVLLDVWVIRSFTGDPRGLDGQALRWCPVTELKEADLLPADKPIIAALALPQIITEGATEDYVIEEFGAVSVGRKAHRLIGVLCSTSAEAHVAAREGAGFVVMRTPMPETELTALCAAITVPIFAAGIELSAAWNYGASGLNQLRL